MKKAGRYRDLPKVSTRHGAEFCLPAGISMQLDSGNGKALSNSHRFSTISATSLPWVLKVTHLLSQVIHLYSFIHFADFQTTGDGLSMLGSVTSVEITYIGNYHHYG
jgi:hypothetical protein